MPTNDIILGTDGGLLLNFSSRLNADGSTDVMINGSVAFNIPVVGAAAFPTITGAGSVTVTGDEATGFTITGVDIDTDTDTFVSFTQNPNGSISTTRADGTSGPTIAAPVALPTLTGAGSVTVTGNPATGYTFTGVDTQTAIAGAGSVTVTGDAVSGYTITGSDANTFVTLSQNADGSIATTNADGTPGPTIAAAAAFPSLTGAGSVTVTGDATNGFTVTGTDVDTFTVPSFATVAGTDFRGEMYAVGDPILTFANGSVLAVTSAGPPADTTAPTLLNPTGTLAGTMITATVDTDEAGGTIYAVASQIATPPTATQIIAGQDSTGAAALSSSQANPAIGTVSGFSFSPAPTGSDCYVFFVHVDGSGNNSNVVTSGALVKAMTSAEVFSDPACFRLTNFTGDNPLTRFTQNVGTPAFSANFSLNEGRPDCKAPIEDASSPLTVSINVDQIPDTGTDTIRASVRFYDGNTGTDTQLGGPVNLFTANASGFFAPAVGPLSDTISIPAGSTHYVIGVNVGSAHNGNPDVFAFSGLAATNP